ncbi:MAG: thioredoxin family protein [Candidatus Saccharibacteria bacterium]
MGEKRRLIILGLVLILVTGVLTVKFTLASNKKIDRSNKTAISQFGQSTKTSDKSGNRTAAALPATTNGPFIKAVGVTDKNSKFFEPPIPPEVQMALDDGQPVWLLFKSATCPACIEQQKTIDKIMPEFNGRIKLITVDVNDPENTTLIQAYGIMYIPTTYLYDIHGKVFYQQVGAIPPNQIRAKLKALLEAK